MSSEGRQMVKHYNELDFSGQIMKRVFDNCKDEIKTGSDRIRIYNLIRYKLYWLQCENENELFSMVGQVIDIKKEKGLDLGSAIQVLTQQNKHKI